MTRKIGRRHFLGLLPAGTFALTYGCSKDSTGPSGYTPDTSNTTTIALKKTADREAGVRAVSELLGIPDLTGKKVVLKPNFNTADPPPASTHNDTLRQIVTELQGHGASEITLAERSYQPFDEVIRQKGIDIMAADMGFEIVNLNTAATTTYTRSSLHWQNGFRFPDIVSTADYLVCTCCLKTHSSGGGFTMSLKLSVGLLPSLHMSEMHQSARIRSMIAEINLAYKPDLIILDGVKAFISGGPSRGVERSPEVILAGTDRIAIDVVGLAILREQGSTQNTGKLFEQEQISRAVDLGLGVRFPRQIEFLTDDPESAAYAGKLTEIISQG